MYVLVFFIALGIVTYITNKSNEVESSYEFLRWEKRDLLVIGILFLLSCVLQILDFIVPKIFILIYLVGSVLALVYVNKNREKSIQEYKKQVNDIFESVSKLVKAKEIDYNELPFKIEKDGDRINKITVTMEEPSKFNDGACTNAVYSLNRYFPYYEWQFDIRYQEQQTIFYGQKLPPTIARWPGSDLRGSRFIPLGVNGDSEVGINLGEKNPGGSLFVFEDGNVAKTSALPSAPQFLVIGSTGGGKSIYVDQELW